MGLEIRFTALAASVFILATGCATVEKQSPDYALVKKIDALESQNKALKEQSIIKRAVVASKEPVSKQVTNDVPFNDEHSLYQAALDAYWKKDANQLKRISGIFVKTFPKSALADNVLYLKGHLDFLREDIRSALETLNQLVEDYPVSNKRVSADLLRAILFARLNLNEQSQDILRRLVQQYPGSAEAKQAKLQLKSESKALGRR